MQRSVIGDGGQGVAKARERALYDLSSNVTDVVGLMHNECQHISGPGLVQVRQHARQHKVEMATEQGWNGGTGNDVGKAFKCGDGKRTYHRLSVRGVAKQTDQAHEHKRGRQRAFTLLTKALTVVQEVSKRGEQAQLDGDIGVGLVVRVQGVSIVKRGQQKVVEQLKELAHGGQDLHTTIGWRVKRATDESAQQERAVSLVLKGGGVVCGDE